MSSCGLQPHWFLVQADQAAFKNFEGSEEEKNAMLGYITRAKMTDKAFSSPRGYFVVPDEENKKLIITEAIGDLQRRPNWRSWHDIRTDAAEV